LPNLLNQDISEVVVNYSEPIVVFNAYKYSYNFDGIYFDEISDYRLKDSGF
jgi:hypothetical protein